MSTTPPPGGTPWWDRREDPETRHVAVHDPVVEPVHGPASSRWTDWRTYVGALGRTLIALGVLIMVFVAYQLWGTGIQQGRAQNRLERQFEQILATTQTTGTIATVAPTTAPTTIATATGGGTLPVGVATTPVSPSPNSGPSSAPSSTPGAGPGQGSGNTPGVAVTTAPAGSNPAPSPSRPVYRDGDPLARLEIPRIGVDDIVVAGVGTAELRTGPGHYPDTVLPGEQGNSAIAGHRTTYGSPFAKLDRLRPGDEIVTTTPAGRFVYLVEATRIIEPSDVDVLGPSDDTRLTLTTCHPRFSTAKRLVVTAVLDPAASSAPQPAPPPTTAAALRPATSSPAVTAAAVTPATSVGGVLPGTTASIDASATTGPGAAAPGTAPDPSIGGATTVLVDARAPDAAVDALGRGWFSDDGAWVPVALWGIVLTMIALGSWVLSRRTGHEWLGALVGLLPFTVALYFWYENVARLLPPNL